VELRPRAYPKHSGIDIEVTNSGGFLVGDEGVRRAEVFALTNDQMLSGGGIGMERYCFTWWHETSSTAAVAHEISSFRCRLAPVALG